MTALERLVVDMVPCGSEGTDVFAEVLAWSTSLRHLTVVLPPWWDRCMFNDVFDEPECRFRSVRRWLTGLAHTTTLETLTLDMLGFLQDECRMLFLAVSENATIWRMTVHRMLEWGCIEYGCRVIREYGLTDRVVISDHNVSPNSMPQVAHVPRSEGRHCLLALVPNHLMRHSRGVWDPGRVWSPHFAPHTYD
ncbi:hypothetical protein MTO96_030523 [Rhipicephalus appendiculatus]